MKKSIIIVIVTVMSAAMLLSGCSKGTGGNPKGDGAGEAKSDQAVQQPDEDAKDKSNSADASSSDSEMIFAKVNSVTGNELELSLAKDPYAELTPDSGENADGSMQAAASTPASEAGEGDGAQQAPKMQLEYTGEEKSVTVPAGVKIADQTGGDGQLESIKKGSVVMIMMNKDSVTDIYILE